MKNLFAVYLLPSILACAWPSEAGVHFEENFNFGRLDPNLVATIDTGPYGYTYEVTTNGNGALRLQTLAPSGQFGTSASIATRFKVVGNFTNSVSTHNGYVWGPLQKLGVKMVNPQGWAGIYFYGSEIRAEVAFPSVTTNAHLGVPLNSTVVLEIKRVGISLALGFYNDEGTFNELLKLTDLNFTSPSELQLFAFDSNGHRQGTFDEWVIRGEAFDPALLPRLTASIAPAAFEISWPSYSNRTYQVWYATILAPQEWKPVGPPTNGTGYLMSQTDWVLGEPRRFYTVSETFEP